MNNVIVNIDEVELEDINGGGLVAGAVIVVGTLVVDHIVEEKTGKDIVSWTGTGLVEAGKGLQYVGEKLMN